MTATTKPFIPRVLRSDVGSVAVEVKPAAAPNADGFTDLYQFVALGPDGIAFLQDAHLPVTPGAMLTRAFLCGHARGVLRWRELT